MSATCCGKSCADCTHRQELNCPGCKLGPGRVYGGDCALAKCCWEKGVMCGECRFKGNCTNYQSRDYVPIYRRRRLSEERRRAEENARRIPFFRKWLAGLFWVSIAWIVMTVVALIPSIRVPVAVAQSLCLGAYCLILLKLSSEEREYRVAGVCVFISVCFLLIVSFAITDPAPVVSLLLDIPMLIVSLIQQYSELVGHESVVAGSEEKLAQRWATLRKRLISMYAVTFGSILVAVIAPGLALIAMLVGAIGVLVVRIGVLICLHSTAKWFGAFLEITQPEIQ